MVVGNNLRRGYNVRKAAQICAFFAMREGGEINVSKLVKLIYLANRQALEKYDYPMLYERLVSMEHGPVNSVTLNYIKGFSEDSANWDPFISESRRHHVGVSDGRLSIDQLDELSRAELLILEDMWGRFGQMSQYSLRDYTHENCPEWEDPGDTSAPIPYARVFKYLKKNNSEALAAAIETEKAIDSALR